MKLSRRSSRNAGQLTRKNSAILVFIMNCFPVTRITSSIICRQKKSARPHENGSRAQKKTRIMCNGNAILISFITLVTFYSSGVFLPHYWKSAIFADDDSQTFFRLEKVPGRPPKFESGCWRPVPWWRRPQGMVAAPVPSAACCRECQMFFSKAIVKLALMVLSASTRRGSINPCR